MKASIIAKIHSTVECPMCQEIMYVPFMLPCGHSSCYNCLYTWLGIKMNCPTCREDCENKPVLNVPLKQISDAISQLMIDMNKAKDESDHIEIQRKEALSQYQEDFDNKALFGDLFKAAVTLIDRSDGVPRCGNCHWEAHGSVCLHCGTRFRISRDDTYYDSDDGNAYDEDDNESRDYGSHEEYDSQDSFIDNSEPVIHLNSDNYLSSDAESYHQDWRGFNSASSQSSEDETHASADLHNALHNFHHNVVHDDDDDDDDDVHVVNSDDDYDDDDDDVSVNTDTLILRRPRVINISDDNDE